MSENRHANDISTPDIDTLRAWAADLGFRALGVADTRGFDRQAPLAAWLSKRFHGEMAYMAREPEKRAQPGKLVPGTVSALMVALDYRPAPSDWAAQEWRQIQMPGAAYVSNYARGRDYHKIVRNRLQKLADRISGVAGPFGYRAFCDSAPVMEVALAEQAGLGWRGKHTLLLDRSRGSMFFLGALFTDLPFPPADLVSTRRAAIDIHTEEVGGHCGSCTRCIDVCPTQAIVAPYDLDARRCISYLTIELKTAIPIELRPLIGNRVYGCDDCQLICPWNKYAQAGDSAFEARHGLDSASLLTLFSWDADTFDLNTRGSPIRRIGYERWLRNLAVGLGNLRDTDAEPALLARARQALSARLDDRSSLVREHVAWALARLFNEAVT